MSFRYMYQDPQAERLLLVVLEQPQYGGSEYRHINARVIRRAVPHKMKDYSDGVETWNDDYADKCFGYRVASYVLTKTSGVYVDDMQLRGQIDTIPQPMRDGKPYGNDIKFKPYNVCPNTARAILDFYTKYARFCDKQEIRRSDEDFYVALAHLANFLKISKVVFYKTTQHRGNSLGEPGNFEEYDLVSAKMKIDELLLPFARTSA